LFLYLPGTDGRPEGDVHLLNVATEQGYRAIGLEYNDAPAVAEVCPRNPARTCSDDFRRTRIYGDKTSNVVRTSRHGY
jgi:hypothetical protein